MKRLKKYSLMLTLALFSYIIPKKPNLLYFFSVHTPNRLSGNLKELQEKIKRGGTEFQTATSVVVGTEAIWHTPFLNFWQALRAEFIVTDGIDSLFAIGRFQIVQLWHGAGYKKIVLTNDKNLLNPMQIYVRSKFLQRTALLIASSKNDSRLLRDSFALKPKVTGLPRNDAIIRSLEANRTLPQKMGHTILYAPTLRDGAIFEPFDVEFVAKLNTALHETGSELLVKWHPKGKFNLDCSDAEHIRVIPDSEQKIEEIMIAADVLITDYSSIATDYALMNKPIIFFVPDFEEYKVTSRGMYYKFEEVAPGPFVSEAHELIDHIKNIDWFYEEIHHQKFLEFRNFFHQYKDDKSSDRVLNHIRSIQLG
jgi:CDP-glycerol glycerophosphotransferase (TagB/SpsB family)